MRHILLVGFLLFPQFASASDASFTFSQAARTFQQGSVPSSDSMPEMEGRVLRTRAVSAESMLQMMVFGLYGDCSYTGYGWLNSPRPHIKTLPKSWHLVCDNSDYFLRYTKWDPMGLDELVVQEIAGSNERVLGSRGRLASSTSGGDGTELYSLDFTPQGIRIDIGTKYLAYDAVNRKSEKAAVKIYDLCRVTASEAWICQRRTEWRSQAEGTFLQDREIGYYLMGDLDLVDEGSE